MKAEARSVSKFKEISYKLENKVVELTQNLQKRTEEKRDLQRKLDELEQQLQQWINRHEEADVRTKALQSSLQNAEAQLSQRDDILQAKVAVEQRLEEALAKAAEKDELIQKLTTEVSLQASRLEQQQRVVETAPVRNQEDNSVIMTLKNEVGNLREQLNRSNALNALTRGSRAEPQPLSPTFAPTLRPIEANGAVNGAQRHQRRHSSAGVYALPPSDHRSSTDELMYDVRKDHALNPRAVSVAFNGEDNYMRFRPNGLPDIRDYEDPAEEKIKLMQDNKRLEEDVFDGLVRGLKIPAPSLTNPSAVKEILFPANLISLITNEMWKYGLIQESERFLANVMQTIQTHVMVSRLFLGIYLLTLLCSHLLVKMRLFLVFSGCRTFMRCYRSYAWPRATCFKVSDLGRRILFEISIGTIMNGWCRSSSTTSTPWSTTSITHGCSKRRRNFPKWSSLPSSRVSHYQVSQRVMAEAVSSIDC